MDARQSPGDSGADAWRAVRSVRASEEVAAQIRRTFYAGMRPGDWLGTETELAERFGVSRATLRDAIRALESVGMVDVKVGAHGGLRVAGADPERYGESLSIQLHLLGVSRDEVLEVMTILEPITARLAAKRATRADIDNMRQLIADSRRQSHDATQFTTASLDFHLAVAATAGNRALEATMRALRHVEFIQLQQGTTRPVARRVPKVHESILEAIEAGDGELAERRMSEHLAQIIQAPRARSAGD